MKTYPLKIFYCYSHVDEVIRDELQKHTKMLERRGIITNWHDRKILPSQTWDKEISEKLSESDIVILIISADFISSDYCFEVEMQEALKLHKEGKLRIIPVCARTCDWKDAPFSHIQGLPLDMKPIMSEGWHNSDEAYYNVVDGLKQLIEDILQEEELAESIISSEEEYVDVEIKINKKFESFSDTERENIVDGISKFLKLNKKIVIKSVKSGSVIITTRLSRNNVDKLQLEVKEGTSLDHLKIVDVSIIQSSTSDLDYADLRIAVLVLRGANHKVRQRLIDLLQTGTYTADEIHNLINVERFIIGQHLAILRKCQIVTTQLVGKDYYYNLNLERLYQINKIIKVLAGGEELDNQIDKTDQSQERLKKEV